MGGVLGGSEEGKAALFTQRAQQGDLDMAVGLLNQNMFVDELSSKIDLHLSLKNIAPGIRPTITIYILNNKSNVWETTGITEEGGEQEEIHFVKCFPIKFLFEERQKIKFELSSKNKDLAYLETHVHLLVNAYQQTFEEQMTTSEKAGEKLLNPPIITIFSDQEEEKGSSNVVHFSLSGKNFSGSRVLFFTILRGKQMDSTELIPVFQSEGVKCLNGEYKWKQVQMLSSIILKNDSNRLIKIQLHKWRPKGNHKLIGEMSGSFSDLSLNKPKWILKNYGELFIERMELEERYSFLDYIFGGCNISLLAAIDYTASNGRPNLPTSLHYFNPMTNQYLKAITAVGGILEFYDSDKQIPVLGFGGIYPGIPKSCHCFAINGNILNPGIPGIGKVEEIYQQSLMKIQLSGPTYFASIIRYASDMALSHVNHGIKLSYFILLILTDGLIMDMEDTITEIVKASSLPLSIIIVGVGSEDFTEMEILDADNEPLYSKSLQKYMERDIVQFVPFSKFNNNPEELAREVLNEVPRQLTQYMALHQIFPQPVGTQIPHFDYFGELGLAFENQLNMHFDPSLVRGRIAQGGIPCADQHHMQIFMQPGVTNQLAEISRALTGVSGQPIGQPPYTLQSPYITPI